MVSCRFLYALRADINLLFLVKIYKNVLSMSPFFEFLPLFFCENVTKITLNIEIRIEICYDLYEK